jgi:cyclopropane-fatty-acyl-phospholipid synthase
MSMNEGARAQPYGASAAAVQSHYDLSNEFYRLWLDPSMTYSCALWHGNEDLFAAQMNKIDWHLERAEIQKGGHILDIGCGWGALLERATTMHGVDRAVGLTFSKAQSEYVNGRDLFKVEVRLESWATHVPKREYDAIMSIGAFEHFARLDQTDEERLEGYRDFFRFCHRALRAGGCLSLQTIVYENASRQDFSDVYRRIFPESDLPRIDEIVRAIHRLFEIVELRNDRDHYARTLRIWLANLRQYRREAAAIVGDETVAAYDQYLGLSAAGFRFGTTNLARFKMRRLGP